MKACISLLQAATGKLAEATAAREAAAESVSSLEAQLARQQADAASAAAQLTQAHRCGCRALPGDV